MIQLNPPIPLTTPKGHGLAHFLIDYGPESDLYWTVFQNDTGEIWTWNNKEVRADKNISLGRTSISKSVEHSLSPVREATICTECKNALPKHNLGQGRWVCSNCLGVINDQEKNQKPGVSPSCGKGNEGIWSC